MSMRLLTASSIALPPRGLHIALALSKIHVLPFKLLQTSFFAVPEESMKPPAMYTVPSVGVIATAIPYLGVHGAVNCCQLLVPSDDVQTLFE